MSETTTATERTTSSRFAKLRWILPLGFLSLTGWLLYRELGELPLPDIQSTLLAVPTLPALGVAALALVSVAFTGFVDFLVARWLKLGIGARDIFRLAFVANSMANTLNLSGAMGASIRLMGLSGFKVQMSRSAALIGMQALSLLCGLSLLVIVTLSTSALPLTSGTVQRWVATAVLIAAALYLPLYFFLTSRRRLMRWLPTDVGLPPLRLKIELTIVSFIDWLLAAGTLYICIYLSGEHVKPGLLLGSFAGAGVLGLVSQVPGGLGVFDGLILLALTEAGYDKASVFSGLLLFRIAYYLVPLLVALYMGSEMLTTQLPLLVRLRTRLAGHPLFGVIGLPVTLLADFGTRLLAVLTFGAGAMQLASAAIPSVREHIELVRDTLPVLAVESSNWFSVLSGVLLLGLARGIDGRLRIAYRGAQWLLLISAALAITKGLHFGEALFLLIVAGLLRARKRVFTRSAMTLTSARTMGWYTGLIVCVLVFFAIGVVQVLGDDSFDLFYFGHGEHTSRIGRGLTAAALGLGLYLIWQVFAVKRPPLRYPDRAELERTRDLYQKHGGGEFAHLTFMGDKHLFWAADHQAVIAYGSVRDRLVALGSPCGTDTGIDRAILDFRHFADAQDRVPIFYEVLEPDLSRYHDHRLRLVQTRRTRVGRSVRILASRQTLGRFASGQQSRRQRKVDIYTCIPAVRYRPLERSGTRLRRMARRQRRYREKFFARCVRAAVSRMEPDRARASRRRADCFRERASAVWSGRTRERRLDAPHLRRAAQHDGLSVREGHAVGERRRLRNFQSRHGAAFPRRRQPVRTCQRKTSCHRIPLRQSFL